MIPTSTDLKEELNGKLRKVVGYFPVDPPDEHANNILVRERRKLEEMGVKERQIIMKEKGVLESAINKTGKNKYLITCGNCGVAQGYVYAKNNKLDDWSDFHYFNWTDGEQWYGCLIPHVSPIDGKLCMRCTCGQDTRDFRANMTLNPNKADKIEKENKKGRIFGMNSSKFKVRAYKGNIRLWQRPRTQM